VVASEPHGHADGYHVRPLDAHPDRLPLLIEAGGNGDPARLADWLRERAAWVSEQLASWGAILLRGFAIDDAPTFERIARAVSPDLENEYLGTSPRNALTTHVFTASELPPFYPIPQHCEMSFLREPPRRLFFCCLVAPEEGSGETPLADFRKVLADLDPAVRARFEERGLRIVRNYAGPGGGRRFDPWRLKRWDEMFGTTRRDIVEQKCRDQGFEAAWTDSGGLRIVSTQPIVRRHPETGAEVWHNHSTTFHLSQAAGEYRRIRAIRPGLRNEVLWRVARALEGLQRRKPTDELAMQCTHLDGSPIADADVESVREAVWRHLVVFPWRRGDVVALDNFAVSHGRLPFRGPRQIAVAWA